MTYCRLHVFGFVLFQLFLREADVVVLFAYHEAEMRQLRVRATPADVEYFVRKYSA